MERLPTNCTSSAPKNPIFVAMLLQRILAFVTRYDRWWLWLGIPLLSVVMHWKVWNLELTGPHVWRQTQTQQAIDAFVEEDFCILNPRKLDRGADEGIQRLEFPLYQWSVAAIDKVLGPSVTTSRCMIFLISLVFVWGMHGLAMALWQDRLAALVAAFVSLFAPVVHYYGVNPMPDMLALAFGVWSLVMVLRCSDAFTWRLWAASVVLAGFATLTKLPYGVFFAGHAVLLLAHPALRAAFPRKWIPAAALLLTCIAPAAVWYAVVMGNWGSSGALDGLFWGEWAEGQLMEIVRFQALELYPRILMSVATLPLFVWGCWQLVGEYRAGSNRLKIKTLLAIGAAILLFNVYELKVIGTFQDYYLLPMVPLLALAVTAGARNLLQSKHWLLGLAAALMIALVPYMTYRRIHPRWRPENAEFNRDLLTYQGQLRGAVPDDALVVAGPDVSHNIFLYYIDKKGWAWDENQVFDAAKLAEWHAQGAAYLYCDDRAYDTVPAIRALLGAEIGRFGSVHVYELK